MAKLADIIGCTTTTTGTGTLTLGAALTGLRTFAAASELADGDVVPYSIKASNGNQETGTGTLGSSKTTLTRTLGSSSTGSLLSLTGTSEVRLSVVASQVGDTWWAANGAGNVRSSALTGVETEITDSTILNGDSVLTGFRKLIARAAGKAALAAAQTFSGAQRGSITTLTPSGTITINANDGNFFTLTPNANFGIANPTNLAAGQSFVIEITQPASGGPRVISSWGSYFHYAGGLSTLPALSTAANAVDVISCIAWTSTRIQIIGIAKDVKA